MSRIPTYKIVSIPGDGIGIEVIEQTLKVLQALESLHRSFKLEFEHLDSSSERYLATGEYIPTNAWSKLNACDAILFGAVGSPSKYTR